MTWKPAPLPDGSYTDDSKPFISQDVINYIPEFAESQGARGPVQLRDAAGLQSFAAAGTGFRGACVVSGIYYAVSGTQLYKVTLAGLVTTLGTIPGAGRCSMSFNQIAGGNQIMIVNGESGYIYNNVTATLTKITADAFPGGIVCGFIGQVFVSVDPSLRQFRNSALADGLTWNGLEFYEGETSPDNIVSMAVDHGALLLFSETTTEVFEYTGTTNALFQNKKIVIPYGCGATFGVCSLDNSTFFVAPDRSIYRLTGYDAVRVSTYAIEKSLAGQDISKCYAFTHEERGHKIAYFCFPTITWGYDCATQKWHRRRSYGSESWRLVTLNFWNGRYYGGDNAGNIYKLDWDWMQEGTTEHCREFTTGVSHANQNRQRYDAIELVIDTGGPVAGYVPDSFPIRTFDLDSTVANTLGSANYYVINTRNDGTPLQSSDTVTFSLVSRAYTGWFEQTFWRALFSAQNAAAVVTSFYTSVLAGSGPLALAGAQATGAVTITGSTSYIIWIPDTNRSDNIGGLSFEFSVI